MSEIAIGTWAFVSVLSLAVSCWLWMRGGRSNKWIRRYVAGALISTTVIGLCYVFGIYNPWLLALYATTIVGFSMGYGGDTTKEKITRRVTFVVGNLASGLLICFVLGGNAWDILPLHAFVAMGTVWLGVKNPMPAAAEEVFVCMLLNSGLIMYPFITV